MRTIKLRRWTPIPVDGVSFAALIVVAFVIGALIACATVPAPSFMGCNDDCVVLNVDNGALQDASLYLNGGRFGYVNGQQKATLMVPRSRLDGGGCLSIYVRLLAGRTFQSTRECIVGNGHFSLTISPLLSTSSLVPFRE